MPSVSWLVLALCRDPSPFAGSAECEPLAPAAHSRQEVGVVLDSVLQLLQEGQVCGLPRTQTLFILQNRAQGDKHRGHHTRSHRHRRKEQSLGSPDRAGRLGQNLTLPSPAPHTAPADTLEKERGKASLLPPNMRLESRRRTKMEMMPLNFSSTRSQMILLLKYWTGSHCTERGGQQLEGSTLSPGSPRAWLPMTCRVRQESTYRNALCFVFLLLRLESQLNEELLQLLVAVVDAELLKAEGQ